MKISLVKKGIVIGIIMLFAGTSFVSTIAGNNEDIEYFTYKSRNLTITYHFATREEIEEMKKDVGVYNPNKNYNSIDNSYKTGEIPPTEKQWDEMIGTLKIADGTKGSLPLRGYVDFTEDDRFPAVGNQGSISSCTAWSLTYYTNGYIQAQQYNWDDAHTGHNKSQLLSPSWTYNKCNGGVDNGSTTSGIAACMNKTGSCTLEKLPHQGYTNWGGPEAWREAPLYRSGDYFYIYPTGGQYTDEDINLIKGKINDSFPVPFTMYTDLYYSLQEDDEVLGVNEMTDDGGAHKNTIIGYDDNIANPNGPEIGAFKIINSWGNGPWVPSYPNADKDGDGCYWITYDAFKTGLGINTVVYIEDNYVNDECPQLIGVWEFETGNCPPRNVSVEINLWDRYVGPLPVETRKPSWRSDSGHLFPSFMCLDITEFINPWAVSEDIYNFSIKLGREYQTWLEGKKIESFYIEYYEDGYDHDPPDPYQKSRKTVPNLNEGAVDLPCRIYVKDFNYSLAPTNLVLIGTFNDLEGGRFYEYTFSAIDSGDTLYYYWDWGDGDNTGWLGPFVSGFEDQKNYGWEFADIYPLFVIAEDKGGFRNIIETQVEVIDDNEAPEQPETPTIESVPEEENTYIFTTRTWDPELNNIFYSFTWKRWSFIYQTWVNPGGTGWSSKSFPGGIDYRQQHTFSQKGKWYVWAHAKDDPWEYESDDSEPGIQTVNYASGCPQGTLVNMGHGPGPVVKNIEYIVVGDIIQSYDITNERLVPAEVIAVHEYILDLPESLLDIDYFFGGNIDITSNHFIFINGTEWMEAGDVNREDFILENPPGTMDIFLKPISSINTNPNLPVISIYDLEIIPVKEGNVSGYFADGVLVGGFI